MGEEGGYTIKNLYQGGYSSIDPTKNEYFTGYNVGGGSLGLTTDPRAAMKLSNDFSTKLSSGVKHIELALVSPELFDNVPKQQLREVNRLAKLTGAEVSVHAPVMDAAGYTRDGRWSEAQREMEENKIVSFAERSHEVNPAGNTTVVFHSADGIGASTWEKLGDANSRKAKKLIVVDRESGGMAALEGETLHYPDMGPSLKEEVRRNLVQGKRDVSTIGDNDFEKFDLETGKKYTPEMRLKSQNNTKWDNEIKKILFETEAAEKTLRNIHPKFREAYVLMGANKLDPSTLSPGELEELKKIDFAAKHLEEASLNLRSSFSKAYQLFKEDGNEEALKKLKELSSEYQKNLGMQDDKSLRQYDPQIQSNAIVKITEKLSSLTPRQFVPIEEFAVEKSAQTFGNAAFKAYEKLGDKAPIIAIENPPASQIGLSTGEDLKNLVVRSREQFAKKLMEEKKLKKKEAEKIAEKFIGATWDVGHINMLRAQGFGEKDIIKETERIAPYVKHVHLSDNFGLEHTELPMGMGNVPMKEIMKRLGQKGFEAKKIIEAGQWWQVMQKPPLTESMEGLGAHFYTGGAGPTWTQASGLYQGYNGGLVGQWLPQTNYETFGTGFSTLPPELGGTRQSGVGGRMGGGRD